MIRVILTLLTLSLGSLASAQGMFSAAITVNGDAITQYELSQRAMMLRLFNTPGDVTAVAREQLIDERLKMQEIARSGMRLSDEGLRAEMERFAARANMSYDQFVGVLTQSGVSEQTLRDFVRVGVTWRDYVRRRYGDGIAISTTDADRAVGVTGNNGTQIQLLLSEIIIAAPPQEAARAMREAEQISRLTSTSAFEAAARRVSALPSRERGGRLGWVPITNYPAQLHPILLGLAQGEVTDPLPITNGIALFQMRGLREGPGTPQAPAQIDYLTYALPAGSEAQAAAIRDRVDRCDDFYGVARGQPDEVLQRQSLAPAQIPGDVAQVLAGLDANEVSWGPLRNDGQVMLMVMLCNRMAVPAEEIDLDAVGNGLLGQQLSLRADALLAELRARAVIR